MFRIFSRIFLVMIIGVIFTSSSDAKNLSRDFLSDQVSYQLTQQMKSSVSGELKVQLAPVYFENITIPDGEVQIKAYLKDKSFSPRKISTVDILVNGKSVKKMNLPVDLKVYDNVWVATGLITRDKNFTSNNTEIQRKDITNIYENVLKADDDITEYVANKNFVMSEIINKKFIKQKPDILKNSTVSAIMQTQNIQIAFQVEATENGCIGDTIRVKSSRYKRYYVGEVVNKNLVLVRI